mmetsp:Transcript_22826/g.32773  ORF Transcript_22826/g.32773 Transcript_22826/m.32773 type:complete len:141 (+) Transcript_22826:332-754(+)
MPHQAGNGSEQCSYALTGLDAAQGERETIAETLRGAGLQGPPSIQPASHSSSSSSSSLASEQEGPVLRSGRRPIPTPAPTGYQQLLPSLGPTLPSQASPWFLVACGSHPSIHSFVPFIIPLIMDGVTCIDGSQALSVAGW